MNLYHSSFSLFVHFVYKFFTLFYFSIYFSISLFLCQKAYLIRCTCFFS
jgi:hypothetical protein